MMSNILEDLVDYSRQSELNDKDQITRLRTGSMQIILGCGGVGYWTGLALAMLGCEKFVLVDHDKVTVSSLNRLPVPQTWVGINKAVCLRKTIRQLRPCSTVGVLTTKGEDVLEGVVQKITGASNYFFWDCTDDARSQAKLTEQIQGFNLNYKKYIKIGYEGLNVGLYKEYSPWFDEDTYRPGYETNQSNVLSSMFAAVVGILKQLETGGDNLEISMLDLITKGVASE